MVLHRHVFMQSSIFCVLSRPWFQYAAFGTEDAYPNNGKLLSCIVIMFYAEQLMMDQGSGGGSVVLLDILKVV